MSDTAPQAETRSYPPPAENPNCRCPNLLAAMFCMTGHMTECHYPMTCASAQCAHLPRYQEGDGNDHNH